MDKSFSITFIVILTILIIYIFVKNKQRLEKLAIIQEYENDILLLKNDIEKSKIQKERLLKQEFLN